MLSCNESRRRVVFFFITSLTPSINHSLSLSLYLSHSLVTGDCHCGGWMIWLFMYTHCNTVHYYYYTYNNTIVHNIYIEIGKHVCVCRCRCMCLCVGTYLQIMYILIICLCCSSTVCTYYSCAWWYLEKLYNKKISLSRT